jgi:dTDP-4-dehydrorhamnose 3,5-epimerase
MIQMLEGINVYRLKKNFDERGYFAEIMRKDLKEVFDEDIVQANHSFTYPNIVRAWHRHKRGQKDYFLVLRGVAKICAYDEVTHELDEIVSNGEELQIVRIPGNYWHGFKALGNEPVYLIYFVNKLYDYNNPDEERRPWNDQAIVPSSINGNTRDARVGKPWDWFTPPHK